MARTHGRRSSVKELGDRRDATVTRVQTEQTTLDRQEYAYLAAVGKKQRNRERHNG